MNFTDATKQVELGKKVRKAGWPTTAFIKKGDTGALVDAAGTAYTPTAPDKAGTDWEISEVADHTGV